MVSLNRDYVSELMKLAELDLDSAEKLILTGARAENAGFFLQQCVKAVLLKVSGDFPKIHDIGVLLGRLPDSCGMPPDGFDLLELNVFSVQYRYEEGPTVMTQEKVNHHVDQVKRTVSWAKKLTN